MTNKEKLRIEKKRNESLLKMLIAEREKSLGHEQAEKLYKAYIAILLKRLGAANGNEIKISKTDITEALKSLEVRALYSDDGEYRLYVENLCEDKANDI